MDKTTLDIANNTVQAIELVQRHLLAFDMKNPRQIAEFLSIDRFNDEELQVLCDAAKKRLQERLDSLRKQFEEL